MFGCSLGHSTAALSLGQKNSSIRASCFPKNDVLNGDGSFCPHQHSRSLRKEIGPYTEMQLTLTTGDESPRMTLRADTGSWPMADHRVRFLSWMTGLLLAALAQGLAANPTSPVVTQTFSLIQGWNAIYLTVDPSDSSPAALFSGVPVTKVATYFPTRTPVEFIQDPASAPWKKQGWSVWFAPTLAESVINDLYSLPGGQGYLVYATANATLSVAGTARLNRIRWRSDSFNLVGFPVDPASPPTFSTWFSGTTAHLSANRASIFALDGGGHWRAVDHPESTQIRPNTAYWVFSRGGSDYQGPLDVAVPLGVPGKGADFGTVAENITVRFRNPTGVPIRWTAEISSAGGSPVTYQLRSKDLATRSQAPLFPAVDFGPLESGAEFNLRLTLDRTLMSQASEAAVLTVRDDMGSLIQIPVTGSLP